MENETKSFWRDRLRRASQIDQYFLNEKCPFSQKRTLKTKNLKIIAAVVLVAAVGFILFAGGNAEREWNKAESAASTGEPSKRTASQVQEPDGSIAMGGQSQTGWGKGTGSIAAAYARSGGNANQRQYGSSQIVRSADGGAGLGLGLPMGSTVPVRLLNTLLSTDAKQPVMAEVLEDASWRNSVLIPMGAKAIGTASFDDTAKRLQIRFNTFVYPEGDQHPVSALALLSDGSSGLPGDYHSGTTQKQIGRFLGDFIGGLADGMKERQAGGQSGIAFEPGSLRNGVLNGITVSSLDQAKSFSEDMQNVKPFLEVPGGSTFFLYLEKEYSP